MALGEILDVEVDAIQVPSPLPFSSPPPSHPIPPDVATLNIAKPTYTYLPHPLPYHHDRPYCPSPPNNDNDNDSASQHPPSTTKSPNKNPVPRTAVRRTSMTQPSMTQPSIQVSE
ncbi:hypothetical protein P280DRAFT_554490 [Massarina eburnea CBS 473.64]|uniref:Uncharacterized protein n=1 Tax=Massarina eburnea CBS 473.64 TaxID=1395130 RepID=A0A6A6RHT6_9PLEO|nr:hypothetical protein P280DRAFT_554490 [Massarina eburnea CBS 473.64]